MNLYNENEPFAAQWLRNLAAAGHIVEGRVDDRSIQELQFFDIPAGQVHFFAGIGVWSRALRLAGWPDDVPVWTGSCPCQPFSQAGRRGGTADDRHLWPEWFRLIRECRPPVIFGEQVASPDGLKWFDIVCADLEGAGYAVAAADISAAGVGAPHVRQRLYFVAYATGQRPLRFDPLLHRTGAGRRDATNRIEVAGRGTAGGVADAKCGATERFRLNVAAEAREIKRLAQERQRVRDDAGNGEFSCGVAQSDIFTCGQGGAEFLGGDNRSSSESQSGLGGGDGPGELGHSGVKGLEGWLVGRDSAGFRVAGATGLAGFWSGADWIYCRDEKWRAVEPGTFPLADGAPARVGRLRAYGNALCAETAATFVAAAIEALDLLTLLGVG